MLSRCVRETAFPATSTNAMIRTSVNQALARAKRTMTMSHSSTLGRLLVALLLAALPTAADTPSDLVAEEHIRLDQEYGGDAFVFFALETESHGPATLAAIELATGERIFLLTKFDLETGIAVQRLDDLSTGWFVEKVVDSGLRHIAEPGTVGGGSTSAWLEHFVALTQDPSYRETISLETVDGGFATWEMSNSESVKEREARQKGAVLEFAQQLGEAAPPVSARRAVALVHTLLSNHEDSSLDHFEDLIQVLNDAFEDAELPPLSEEEMIQSPTSVRVPLADSKDEIKRLRRSLKTYIRTSME